MKVKRFSGYSESSPNGVSYISGQVISNYVLNPINKSIHYIDSTKLGNTDIVKKKSKRIKSIVNPLKKVFKNNN